MHMYARLLSALLFAGLLVASGAARADQIDGHWCAKDGRSVTIDGPTIVTPAGNKLQGDYDRHGFTYVVPAGEPGTGDAVLMLQQNDTTIHVWEVGAKSKNRGALQVWRRCQARTS